MKTKIKKYILLLFASAMAMLSACNDFLEMETVGKIPQEEFYSSDEFAANSIYAAYDLLQTLYGPNWNSIWQIKTVLSDEANAGGGDASDQIGFQNMSSYTHSTSNEHITNAYGSLYACINRCNVVLAKITDDSDVKKRIRAEAKCIRAYCYFELVTMWQNVPIVLEELEAGENPSPAVPSAIWTQIEKDLSEAATDLPLEKVGGIWRVTKGTAQGLLGKALVYQEKFSEAITPLKAVVDAEEFELIGDYSQILRKGQEFGKESMFEVGYSADHLESNGDFQWGNGRLQEINITWQLCGPRLVELGSYPIRGGWGHVTPKKGAWDAFVDAGDDVRRRARILSDDELIAAGGGFEKDAGGDYGHDIEGYVRLAYTTYVDENEGDEWSYGTNYRILRFADIKLLLAEAYEETGDAANAEIQLNDVRDRVDLADYDVGTDGPLDEAIFSERQRELMFESQRWGDVIRKGKGIELFGFLGFVAGKHELLPIPATEIDVNPNMKQNPGW